MRKGLRLLIAFAISAALLSSLSAAVTPPPVAPEYVEGDVIVTFKPTADMNGAKQALKSHSLGFERHYSLLSQWRGRHCGLVRDKSRSTAALIAELSRDPLVESAEPNYIRHVTAAPPNDTDFPLLWGLQNSGQFVNNASGVSGDDIKFVPAWAMARPTTNQVVVGVIDSGVDYTHPDLAPNMWVNPGEIAFNGVDDDGNGFVDDVFGYDFIDGTSDPSDSGFHGTHVAGTIAAVGNNMMGVVGVDYQARIMALRVSNDGSMISTSAAIEALQYATMMKGRGVNVVAVNESFGGPGSSSAESSAIQAAGSAGIILCAAAGNSGINNDATPFFPASYRLSNMIVVAASAQNDTLASFSNFGANTVDLAAPGVNILSTKPVNPTNNIAFVHQGSTNYLANSMNLSPLTAGVTGNIVHCGIGNPGDFPAAVSNNIALIMRGTLNFSVKVQNAMNAGAKAAVIYNNASGNYLGNLVTNFNWIPAISLSQADGQALLALLPTSGTVVNQADQTKVYQFLDGTSMATPHVSGAVAFAAMNFPGDTVAQRIQRVLGNVDVIPALSGLVRTGGRLNILRTVDTDGNGLPDWWEQEFFGQPTGVNPNGDADHDGMSNVAEFLAGTNPTNAVSALRLSVSRPNGAGVVTLSWPSVAGKSYRIQRSTNLLTGFNTLVQTNIAATAPTNSVSDTAVVPGSAKFYRLMLEQ